jgi:hypothetical protein
MAKMKRYYNPLPIDGDTSVQHKYSFDRMREIIKWNEIHCDYWCGIDYQIDVHRKSIECYVIDKGTLQWYEDLKCWDQIELEMLLLYKRDLVIRNILE